MDALANQSLSFDNWELIIVDNCSSTPVSEICNLKWHPNSRIVVEDKLGLTFARFRGINEAASELLVFVDDDNILDQNYLEQALKISIIHPTLGAWGGSCIGEFEVPPPPWFHISILGVREVKEDTWSFSTESLHDCPIGAGMVIRKIVAKKYVYECSTNPIRTTLDRAGNSLMGAGDFDLAFTACDMGLSRGLFKDLKLIHHIPAKRLTREYFIRMKEGLACSLILLAAIRKEKPTFYRRSLQKRIAQFFKRLMLPSIEREILYAKDRGRAMAMGILHH